MTPVLPTYARSSFVPERGEGPYLFGADRRRVLDFGAGIATSSVGHSHPHVVAALMDQAQKVWHVSNLHQIPQQERLAERLVAATFAETVFFCNSGAEANEAAIKMARRYHYVNGAPERYRVITFEGAFHGRTLATIAAGGQPKHLEGFGPKVDGFDQVPFADHDAIRAVVGPETAAIMIEPIQGEGGIRPVPSQCLRDLRELCDEHGILLIFDEVQTGMGRTGTLFAHEQSGMAPDIMSSAKGIGGGFPLGACLATERAASGMAPGTHGTTYGGSPLACAVGNAVLDVVGDPATLEQVRRVSNALMQRLAGLKDSLPQCIETVRGAGLMIGIKLKPSMQNVGVFNELIDRGLLTAPAGDNVVRFVPPLIVTEEHAREAVDILEATLSDLAQPADAAGAGAA